MMLLEALSSALPSAAEHAPAGGKAASSHMHLAPPLSTQTSISSLGRTLSKTSGTSPHQDIEDSDLPDSIKSMLRMIRDLRQMLDRLARELQQVQADKQMPAEAKRARLLQLQAQISAVNSSLIQTTQKLASLIRNASLDRMQQMTAGQLAL